MICRANQLIGFYMMGTLVVKRLIRKAAVINKLDEKLLDNNEDENEIEEEIDAAEEFQNFVRKKGIKIEQFFARIKDEENRNRMLTLEQQYQ